ncbi:hypothetical protein PN466_14910 [Roseofilum reptotaenium CS-1145]|nr:hypothetical protein [Roseofilum reptotaenium CS-1145]
MNHHITTVQWYKGRNELTCGISCITQRLKPLSCKVSFQKDTPSTIGHLEGQSTLQRKYEPLWAWSE